MEVRERDRCDRVLIGGRELLPELFDLVTDVHPIPCTLRRCSICSRTQGRGHLGACGGLVYSQSDACEFLVINPFKPLHFRRTRETSNTCETHKHSHETFAHHHTHTHRELGVDTPGPVGPA